MKKYLFISLIFIFTINLFTNELDLDEEYLNSLPPDVRADVIAKSQARESIEEPVYRRASTMIDKSVDGYLGENEYLDKQEKDEEDEPKVFGHKFFDTMQTSFMPVNEPNFDSNYVLDFGDIIELQLVGDESDLQELNIKRDGSVFIEDVGKVFLAGLSLESASELIKSKIKAAYIGTEAYISLTSIRDVQVLISGNAFNPGVYTLSGNSNLIHAVTMAGGLDELGSYRNIDLVRNNEVIFSLDLYDVLIKGKASFGPNLRSGDTVFINKRNNIVNMVSGVNRPSLYELKDKENLNDLLYFANGFNANSDKENIYIQSLKDGNTQMIRASIDNLSKYELDDGDSVIIREFKIGSVKVLGAVKSPGTYIITDKETLSSVIYKAGGYSDRAYAFGGFLNNKKTEEINKEAKEKLYNNFILNIIQSGASYLDDKTFPVILKQLKDTKTSGRVMAEFNLDAIKNDSELDTMVEDGDEIIIPNLTQQVYIYGEVNNEGTVRYKANQDILYYLKSSGGINKETADINNIYIVHPNGETERLSANRKLSMLLSPPSLDQVYPGSIIYIPKKSRILSGVENAAVWAPILSSLALSITSLSVLENN